MDHQAFPCSRCGAEVEFRPGGVALQCTHCGFENPLPGMIEGEGGEVRELDYHQALEELEAREETRECFTVKCGSCGAETSLPAEATAGECAFCGTNVVAAAAARRGIPPRALLPFRVTREEAQGKFRAWLKGLWFAPGDLKSFARADHRLTGMYVPYWTYDCDTRSAYSGQRGDDYWVTEHYTTTENGKTVRKSRQVRKTRWTAVSGTVENRFDDVLVLASRSLPRENAVKLEPWDLQALVPYQDGYLSGYRAERYQVDLKQGFEEAKGIMDEKIRASICGDIGGDHQRIHSVRTSYRDITYKHLLLPVWLSAYRWRRKVYRFLVNARTGEVQGERPWSAAKIALLVLALLAAAGTVAAVIALSQ